MSYPDVSGSLIWAQFDGSLCLSHDRTLSRKFTLKKNIKNYYLFYNYPKMHVSPQNTHIMLILNPKDTFEPYPFAHSQSG